MSYSYYILASILLIILVFWEGVFWVEVLNWDFGVGFLVDKFGPVLWGLLFLGVGAPSISIK